MTLYFEVTTIKKLKDMRKKRAQDADGKSNDGELMRENKPHTEKTWKKKAKRLTKNINNQCHHRNRFQSKRLENE